MNNPVPQSYVSRRTVLQSAMATAALLGLGACSRSSETSSSTPGSTDPMVAVNNGTLSFAACLPISGAFTIITKPWAAAMAYACDERNQAGGLKIQGKTVKAEAPLIDEGYAAAPALASVQKFFSQGGHYVGGLVSEEAPVAVLGINQQADALVATCINGSPAFSDNSLRFFVDALNYSTGLARARFAYDELGLRRMATIELKNSWGASYQESFAKAFTELGGEVVVRDYMQVTETDFSSRISAWKQQDPDGLYIIIGDGPGTTIGTQATDLGFDSQPILTEGAWDPNSYQEAGASFIERCYYLAQYPYCHFSDEVGALAERLYKDHQLYLTNWFWQGYDSTRMVLDAMEVADSTAPADVIEALPEAVETGADKWLIKAPGVVKTADKGVFLQVPLWMSKFKSVDTDFLSEAPLEPVSNTDYHEIQGWLPEEWDGYTTEQDAVAVPSNADLQSLLG